MAVDSQKRIGGWLLLPLVWLILLLAVSCFAMIVNLGALSNAETRYNLLKMPTGFQLQWGLSLLSSILLSAYSAWVTWIFFKRSRRLPRHYIIWLLLTVLLAIKTFAYAPVPDDVAVQSLLLGLLPAAFLVPYFRRSQRVKTTFIND